MRGGMRRVCTLCIECYFTLDFQVPMWYFSCVGGLMHMSKIMSVRCECSRSCERTHSYACKSAISVCVHVRKIIYASKHETIENVRTFFLLFHFYLSLKSYFLLPFFFLLVVFFFFCFYSLWFSKLNRMHTHRHTMWICEYEYNKPLARARAHSQRAFAPNKYKKENNTKINSKKKKTNYRTLDR